MGHRNQPNCREIYSSVRPYLSHPPCQDGSMTKTFQTTETLCATEREEVIAQFGQARLVRLPSRRYLLRGGSQHDEWEAREWVSMFMHEITFNVSPVSSAGRSGIAGTGERRTANAERGVIPSHAA